MDSMYEYAMDMALKNATNVGSLLGVIGFTLKWGDLNDSDYKTLAQAYLKVVGDDEFNAADVDIIRTEASRRGIVLG
jgi:hypothetical protein